MSDQQKLKDIEDAIRDYHYALDTRQHGGVARDNAFHRITQILDMPWVRGQEKQRRVGRHVDTGIKGFYGQYDERSIGRVIHFLYDIYHCINADSFTVGNGVVNYGSRSVATYTWVEDTDVPKFSFTDDYKHLDLLQKDTFLELLGEGPAE